MYEIPKSTGLTPRVLPWRDPRTFNHEQKFGGGSDVLSQLPAEGLGRVPISVENQQGTDFCTAYCTSTAAEYIEQQDMSPEFQVAKISEYVGYPILQGAPALMAMRAACLFGALPKKDMPAEMSLDNSNPQEISDPTCWPKPLNDIAATHKMGSFFDVLHGSLDYFDNMRNALFLAKQAGENRVVMAFTQFWNVGIGDGSQIIRRGSDGFTWHAHLFIDWAVINGETVLVEQNSFGQGWGIPYGGFQGGFSYWSREAINQFAEDSRNEAYMFRDVVPGAVKEEQWTMGAIIYDMLAKISLQKAAAWLNNFVALMTNTTNTPAQNETQQPATPTPTLTPTPAPGVSMREKIFTEATHWLGKDASPKDNVPDEVGCVDSLGTIIRQVMDFPEIYSTAGLLDYLNHSKAWKATLEPKPGNLIVCATGTGNGSVPNGHCGIHAGNDQIMSNDSSTGLWMKNYTIEGWVKHFRQIGGYRVHYFEAIG